MIQPSQISQEETEDAEKNLFDPQLSLLAPVQSSR